MNVRGLEELLQENTHWANTVHFSFGKSRKYTGGIKNREENSRTYTDVKVTLEALYN